MPERYLKIKKQLVKKGVATATAKKQAAKIYNATRTPGTPKVTSRYKQKQ